MPKAGRLSVSFHLNGWDCHTLSNVYLMQGINASQAGMTCHVACGLVTCNCGVSHSMSYCDLRHIVNNFPFLVSSAPGLTLFRRSKLLS